jgi:predicted nucleic acid-binding protein
VDIYFLDSSALIKRYVTETGSAWVTNLIEPTSGNRIYVARITAVEVVSASSVESDQAILMRMMLSCP